jgi:hypothetical protein
VTEHPPIDVAPATMAPRPAPIISATHQQPSQNLADVLERVLDKGVVIIGDIQVRLLDIELLTIKVRLMVASVERAREMGINWWEGDPFVTQLDQSRETDGQHTLELQRRVAELERRLTASTPTPNAPETLAETCDVDD